MHRAPVSNAVTIVGLATALLLGGSGGCALPQPVAERVGPPIQVGSGQEVDLFAGPAGSLGAAVFISHECPIANAMAPDLIAIAAQARARGVDFYAIHAGSWADEAALAAHAQAYGLDGAMTVLVDRRLRTVRALGATVTPEGVVFRRDGVGGFERLYLGRVNDLYAAIGRRRARPITNDLADAIDAAAAGRPVAARAQPAVGCFIEVGGTERDAEK
jgi:hypothetical protein